MKCSVVETALGWFDTECLLQCCQSAPPSHLRGAPRVRVLQCSQSAPPSHLRGAPRPLGRCRGGARATGRGGRRGARAFARARLGQLLRPPARACCVSVRWDAGCRPLAAGRWALDSDVRVSSRVPPWPAPSAPAPPPCARAAAPPAPRRCGLVGGWGGGWVNRQVG